MRSGGSRRNARKRALGIQFWTPSEDDQLRAGYPSYAVLQETLPHRTLAALKNRVRVLGIVRRRHVWTNQEVRRLHAAFDANVPDAELQFLFPGLNLYQIKGKARHVKAARRRVGLVTFGIPSLDTIRLRAREAGMSLAELDRRARTGRFFQKSCRKPRLRHIIRAAIILGGDVRIEWLDRE